MGITGLVTLLWFLAGYSLSFNGSSPFYGDLSQAFFNGLKPGSVGAGYYWISDSVWAMFQLTFAIITPALIFGATAERMKFISVLVFTAIWMFAVYFPLAHMVWSVKGFMCGTLNPDAGIKAIDFAGGTVVHMSSGWSALVLCLILGLVSDSARSPCLRTRWCFAWLVLECSSLAGSDSTPAPRSVLTPLPPMPFAHVPRRGHRRSRVGCRGMAPQRQAQRARLLLGYRGWPRGHHPGLRFRDCLWSCDHRHRRRYHPVPRGDLPQEAHRL